ncbi:HET-domain-containing protein [Periconia macrospinosa]|uniref:HET-domain-containing protein n=1 Tax=Periconia macrospinosa TaxID=97972 RepID=A0A2V1E9I4_9PLEO|nr:HET-domain-containing protein [Periconia macrospinosa]
MNPPSQVVIDTAVGATVSDEHPSLCDVETFCEPCLEVVQSLSPVTVKVHNTLEDVLKCGEEKCRLCRFLCKTSKEINEGLSNQHRVPWVELRTTDYESETRLVQKLKIQVKVEDWGRKEDYSAFRPNTVFRALGNEARGANRAIWSQPGPINFAMRKDTVLEWLKECQTNHPKCKDALKAQTSVAARMLEVKSENGELRVRLVSSMQGPMRNHSPYFVLTHCWGGVEIEAKLTAEKLEVYHKNIDVSTLPKTFQEALEITNALQCRYLWIDSLCIVQGDAEDWAKESRKMAAIFKGAQMTISASEASNSRDGCGISNLLSPAKVFTINRRTKERPARFFSLRLEPQGIGNEYEMHRLFWRSPIHTRAWIFQEKILSHRILHTTQSQLFWQCATQVESEDGTLDTRHKSCRGWDRDVLLTHVPDYLFQPESWGTNIRHRWWGWINEYQRRILTNPTDRYAAFAGVTEHYRSLTNDTPIFGLWDRDLHLHLAWHAHLADHREPMKPLEERRNPSWTWMTFPHGSVYVTGILNGSFGMTAEERRSELKYRYEAKVLNFDIEWTDRPLVSKPARGTIQLRGLFDRIILPRNRFGNINDMDPDFICELADKREIYDQEFDVIILYAYEEESTLTTNLDSLISVGLVLKTMDAEKRMYRRIGRVEVKNKIPLDIDVEKLLPGTFQDILLV